MPLFRSVSARLGWKRWQGQPRVARAASGSVNSNSVSAYSTPDEHAPQVQTDSVMLDNMPPHHNERHSGNPEAIRNIIIGFADGLTVPFALTAGLTAFGSSRLVVIGGLAELFAGAISMGLGAWLADATEKKTYEVEELRERHEVRTIPDEEEEEIYEIFEKYNLSRGAVAPLIAELRTNEDRWVEFMMEFELRLQRPASKQAWISAMLMGCSYLLGGIIPMIPYFGMHNVAHALFVSIAITVVELLVFGYIKAVVTGLQRKSAIWSALQTLLIGALAAGVSYGIVRGVNGLDHQGQ